MFKKIKSKILYDLNYTNRFAYVSLSIFSICCLLSSFFFATDSKLFVILSAIGCSGIVSVVVAALVEKSNNRAQKKRDEKIIEHLLFSYDLYIKSELQRALICCEKNKAIDLDREYSVQEIRAMLDNVDYKNVYFKGFPTMLEKSINGLSSINFLEFQRNEDGLTLYSLFENLQSYVSEMKKIVDEDWASELLKILVLSSLNVFDEINSARNKNIKYSISEDTAQYLLSFRKAKEKAKEEQNVQH